MSRTGQRAMLSSIRGQQGCLMWAHQEVVFTIEFSRITLVTHQISTRWCIIVRHGMRLVFQLLQIFVVKFQYESSNSKLLSFNIRNGFICKSKEISTFNRFYCTCFEHSKPRLYKMYLLLTFLESCKGHNVIERKILC